MKEKTLNNCLKMSISNQIKNNMFFLYNLNKIQKLTIFKLFFKFHKIPFLGVNISNINNYLLLITVVEKLQKKKKNRLKKNV